MTATLSNWFYRGFLLDPSIKGNIASTYNTRVKVLKEIGLYVPASFLGQVVKRIVILAIVVVLTVGMTLALVVTLGLKKSVRDRFIEAVGLTAGVAIGFAYDIISFVGEELCGVLGLFSPSVYVKFLEKRGDFEEKHTSLQTLIKKKEKLEAFQQELAKSREAAEAAQAEEKRQQAMQQETETVLKEAMQDLSVDLKKVMEAKANISPQTAAKIFGR